MSQQNDDNAALPAALPGAFVNAANSATAKLAADALIQDEVRREVLGHLLADLDARIEAGEPRESAEQAALADFGDPATLAGQLYAAHRRRILRRKAARWALAGVVAPATALSLTYGIWQIIFSLLLLLGIMAGSLHGATEPPRKALQTYINWHVTSSAAADFVAGPRDLNEVSAWIERAAKSWPGDEAVQVNLALSKSLLVTKTGWWSIYPRASAVGQEPTVAEFAQVDAAMEQAKERFPGNGIFAFYQGAILLRRSLVHVRAELVQSDWPPAFGKSFAIADPEWRLEDLSLFAQGEQRLREAASAAFITSDHGAVVRKRLSLLPPSHSLVAEYARSVIYGDEAREIWIGQAMACGISTAIDKFKVQDRAHAEALCELERQLSVKASASSDLRPGASNMLRGDLSADLFADSWLNRAQIASDHGDHTAYDVAISHFDDFIAALTADNRASPSFPTPPGYGTGVMDSIYLRWQHLPAAALKDSHRAEYLIFDGGLLLGVCTLLFMLAGAALLLSLLFPGTRAESLLLPRVRDAALIALAGAGPSMLYIAAAHAWSGLRSGGALADVPPIAIEYGLVVFLTAWLTASVHRRTFARLSKSISPGQTPARQTDLHFYLGIALLVLAVAMTFGWTFPAIGPAIDAVGSHHLPTTITYLLIPMLLAHAIWSLGRLLSMRVGAGMVVSNCRRASLKLASISLLLPASLLAVAAAPILLVFEHRAAGNASALALPVNDLTPNVRQLLAGQR